MDQLARCASRCNLVQWCGLKLVVCLRVSKIPEATPHNLRFPRLLIPCLLHLQLVGNAVLGNQRSRGGVADAARASGDGWDAPTVAALQKLRQASRRCRSATQ